MITINIDKAKEIQKGKLRVERAPLLQKLDIEYLIATEKSQSAKKKEIAAKKQLLRDITSSPLFERARSIEEIQSITLPTIG